MQRELLAYLDIKGKPVLVGRLWARERAGRESSCFAYDPSWLKRKDAFALSPTAADTILPLSRTFTWVASIHR